MSGCDKGQSPATSDPQAAKKDAPAVEQKPRSPDATFAWNAPAKAQINERVLRNGKWTGTKYDLEVSKSGDTYELRFANFAYTEIPGYDLTKASVRKQLGRLEAHLRLMVPDFRVSGEGKVTEVIDYPAMVDSIAKDAKKLRISPAELEGMRSEGSAKIALGTATETWTSWVDKWNKYVPLEPKFVFDKDVPHEAAGQKVVASQHYEYHEPGELGEKLIWRETFDNAGAHIYGGDVLTLLVGQHFEAKKAAEGKKKKKKEDPAAEAAAIEETVKNAVGSMVFEYEFIGDGKTLIPRAVNYRKTISAKVGEETLEWREDREWTFAWGEAGAAPAANEEPAPKK
jgi:hypothetical protein